MILDARGRKISIPTESTAKAVVFVSDDGESWSPEKSYNLPDWVKEPDAMGYMLSGEILSIDDTGPYYKAERI